MAIGYLALALVLAIAAPLALIATRRELQGVRFQIIKDLQETVFKDQKGLPQIELVAARYRSKALERRNGDETVGDRQGSGDNTRNDRTLIWHGAAAFVLISFLGFSLLLTPLRWLFSDPADFPRLAAALLWIAPGDGQQDAVLQSAGIAGMGFLGAYVFWVGYLIRATLNEELSALAFVRGALGMMGSILVVLVLYQTLGKAMGGLGGLFGETGGQGTYPASVGVAFLIGTIPTHGIKKLAAWLGIDLKGVSSKALKGIEIIPLQVIDGIDNEASVRLQESGLYDVQNLATANPLELYAETPFGLFETFDWVLQAQLCLIVGPDTFKQLKIHNIRTIFDLERAVLAQDAPAAYVKAIGSVIFQGASDPFRNCLGLPRKNDAMGACTASVDAIRHAVAIIGDDLHVHRLRALWTAMLQTTSAGTRQWLYETGPLPGETADIDANLPPAAANAVRVTATLAELYAAAAEANDPKRAAELKAQALDTASLAIALDPAAKEHLRLRINPGYLRKGPGEASLEIFAKDPDFEALLR